MELINQYKEFLKIAADTIPSNANVAQIRLVPLPVDEKSWDQYRHRVEHLWRKIFTEHGSELTLLYTNYDPIMQELSKDYNASTFDSNTCILKPFQSNKKVVSFNDIAGLEATKADLMKSFVYPMMYPGLFKKLAKGVLLYGPPGTAKTMLAKATTHELTHTVFFTPTPGDIKGKYEGETEKNIASIFECASGYIKSGQYNKAVIFFDEFDSIARSGRGEDPSLTRSVNALLQAMDGINSNPNVLVLAATNSLPTELDSAVMRRFSRKIFVDLPGCEARLFKIKQRIGEQFNFPEDLDKFKNQNIVDAAYNQAITNIAWFSYIRNQKKINRKQTNLVNVQPYERLLKQQDSSVIVDSYNTVIREPKPRYGVIGMAKLLSKAFSQVDSNHQEQADIYTSIAKNNSVYKDFINDDKEGPKSNEDNLQTDDLFDEDVKNDITDYLNDPKSDGDNLRTGLENINGFSDETIKQRVECLNKALICLTLNTGATLNSTFEALETPAQARDKLKQLFIHDIDLVKYIDESPEVRGTGVGYSGSDIDKMMDIMFDAVASRCLSGFYAETIEIQSIVHPAFAKVKYSSNTTSQTQEYDYYVYDPNTDMSPQITTRISIDHIYAEGNAQKIVTFDLRYSDLVNAYQNYVPTVTVEAYKNYRIFAKQDNSETTTVKTKVDAEPIKSDNGNPIIQQTDWIA